MSNKWLLWFKKSKYSVSMTVYKTIGLLGISNSEEISWKNIE